MIVIALLVVALAASVEVNDDAKWVAIFTDPGRDVWQKPEAVIQALGVAPGMTVAELGAGTGYFTVHLAKAVGPNGHVLAIEDEPNFLEQLQERATKAGLKQIVPVLDPPDDADLPGHGVDIVLVVNTWRHIENRLQYIMALADGMKPTGRIAIVDFKEGAFPVGPPDAKKLTEARVIGEFKSVGWKLASRYDELPYQYVLVFTPPAASGGASESPSKDR